MNDVSDLAKRRARLSPARQALLERRLRGKRDAQASPHPGASPQAIPRLADGTAAPLSFAQERLWFAHQWDPEIAAYNRPTALRLTGELDLPSLERSLSEILERHEILRTAFPATDGQPVPQVGALPDPVLSVTDLSHLPQVERLAAAQQRMLDSLRRPFALECGPLYRACLLRLDVADHLFFFVTHHILFDGWSEVLFVNELCALYGSFRSGAPVTLPDLPIQYTDFAAWQRDQIQDEILKAQMAYWQEKLEGPLPILDLPTDHPRPSVQTFHGATRSLVLSRPLVADLEAISRQEDVTLFMCLLAAFKVMLFRYTGQTDLIVGTPVASRRPPETRQLMGVFVNTLALRTELDGDPTFQELLQRVRQTCLGATSHQDLPFDTLVADLNPQRDLAHTPVFQVLFNLENLPDRASSAGDMEVVPFDLEPCVALFDLSVELVEREGEIHCMFVYNTDLFDAGTVQRMAGHYETLLQGVVTDAGQRISHLPLLTEAERHQLLVEWNDTRVDYQDLCLHQSFEAQVERTPEAVALLFRGQQLTYEELNQRANQLAHHLQRLGVGPETLVGVYMERSPEMVIALLGILKAGGAYVPMDPSYPPERLSFMLSDSQALVLLTQKHLRDRLGESPNRQENGSTGGQDTDRASRFTICLDADWEAIAQQSDHNPTSDVGPDNLCYVIYTSGSTGQPKGVMVCHRGLTNYLAWCRHSYPLDRGTGAPVHSSISFDLTVTGLFAPLLVGRQVHLLPEDAGIETLSSVLQTHAHYSLVKITPAHLELLSQQLPHEAAASCTWAFVIGGENLLGEQIAWWQEHTPNTVLVNEYGPTETVVGCCAYQVLPGERIQGAVPIGRPISNTQLVILDKHMQPVPIGVPGELYIGGIQVARGYLNQPELTADKFIPDPFSSDPQAHLFKTGDLARYRPDGNIEFLGRLDFQVKVRGFRIELGEIEAVLSQLPAVREVVVMAREDTPGDKRLVAYLLTKSSSSPSVSELRSWLKESLPDYMVPAAFVFLDALPLTPNGKVDRARLPAPDQHRPELEDTYVAPRTPTEAELAGIWARVLGLDRVGVHDDFFELGGHSLVATQVLSRVRDAFHFEVQLRSLFERPTVAGLASFIEQILSALGKPEAPGAERAETREEIVL